LHTAYFQNFRRLRREAWIVLLASVALGFTWVGLSDAIVNLHLVRIGFGPQFVGTSAALASLGYALAAMPGAALARRIGARRGMIAGSLAWVGGMMLLSAADLVRAPLQESWIIAMRLVASSGLALNAVSSQPYLTTVTSPEERPHAFALVISLRPLGGFFGGLLGGLLPGLLVSLGLGPLTASLSQPRPYGITLALGMLVFLPVVWWLWTLPRDDPKSMAARRAAAPPAASGVGQKQDPDWDRLSARSRSAPYGVLAAIALVCALRVGGEFAARNFFSVYVDATWGITAAQIGSVVAVSSLLSIPAPLITPALVQRYGRVATIAAGAFGVALSIVLLAVGGSWAIASIAFITMSILAAVARSVWSLMIQESVDDVWRPTSAAVANLFSGLGNTIMSSVGGVLADGVGYRATFMTSAALVALGAVTVWAAFRGRFPLASSRE